MTTTPIRQDVEDALAAVDEVWPTRESSRRRDRSRSVKLLRASEMKLTNPNWLLKGWFERPSLSLVFGAPGCGKSFLGVEIACCVATGRDFHGRRVKAGPVVYVAGEGYGGISRRLQAWRIVRDAPEEDPDLFVTTAPVGLSASDEEDALFAAVAEQTQDCGNPHLVVVDTLARNFGPGDENSTESMSAFVAACDRIRVAYDCTVLLIHHTGHTAKERARGNSALMAATDTTFRMDKDESGVIRVENIRQKDAELLGPQAFKLRSVELGLVDEDGRPVTSAVLHPTDYGPPASSARGTGLGKNQQQALNALREVTDRHRTNVAEGGRDPDEARVSVGDWKKACESHGLDRRRFGEVRHTLVEVGLVQLDHGFVRIRE